MMLLIRRNLLKFVIATFSIFLFSCSGGDDTPVEITITVSATDFSVLIPENPTNGDVLGIVHGTTNQGSISFTITQQSESGALTIASDGTLTVANAALFNFEARTRITATVLATNSNVSDSASVTIDITDVPESNNCVGPVFLLTQADVDSFGAMGCTSLDGSLIIGDDANPNNSIVDLSPIAGLQTIDGWLDISGNLALTTMAPLNSITSITGGIEIIDNPLIENLLGLEGLVTLDTPTFNLYNNDALTSIEGLHNIEIIKGSLNIGLNDMLVNLDNFTNLVEVQRDVNISRNDQLLNVEGLNNITNVPFSLIVEDNGMLNSIEGLRNITQVGGGLRIDNNDQILNLNGLRNLATVGTFFDISFNDLLIDLSQLNSLTTIGGSFTIRDNPSLQNFNGLTSLLNIGDDLSIDSNNALSNIDGLSTVTVMDGTYLRVTNNVNLVNLDGFANMEMTNFSRIITIEDNTVLTDLCGLMNFDPPQQFNISGNGYNPSFSDIASGNCST